MKHNIQEQLIGKSIMRCIAILAVLLMTFVLEASAQKYYVIYYDDTSTNPATRHYLSINEDGKSINDETALSARCYWVADNSLKEADGNWGEYQNTEHSNYTNRLPLYSYAHKKKYLDGVDDDDVRVDVLGGKLVPRGHDLVQHDLGVQLVFGATEGNKADFHVGYTFLSKRGFYRILHI